MASSQPYDQLTGVVSIYIAPYGTTVPDVDDTPGGSWVELGNTDGEQSIQHSGKLTYFEDNSHQGPVKAVRPTEREIIKFTVVSLTMENFARILDQAANVIAAAGPPATKTVPFKRGPIPYEYAVLMRGAALSPYGLYPGMYVVPRAVFDNEPTETFAKDGRPALDCEMQALEDDQQSSSDNKLGWMVVQTS